ncbi:MAG: sigma 54-interacting transcriptional regulator, partial [Myxococcota bacterium]
FTGATERHVGAFERADGGTIFLDEIADLPLDVQGVLLGAIERRRFVAVGGKREITADVRVVCATHRDLRTEVNRGRFRHDLYYRLAVIVARMPPLRDRVEDIPLLIEHFATRQGFVGSIEALVSPEVMRGLERHPWPGNVRELRNMVEATLAMGELALPESHGSPVATHAQHAVPELAASLLAAPFARAREQVLADFERHYVEAALRRSGGNVSAAARAAGLDRSYLARIVRRLGLDASATVKD